MESERVRVHLRGCEPCRALFAELRDLHAVELAHVPSLAAHRGPEMEARLKDSILRAARAEGLRAADAAGPIVAYRKPTVSLVGSVFPNRRWFVAASIGALAACLVLAFVLRSRVESNPRFPGVPAQVSAAPTTPTRHGRLEEAASRQEEVLRAQVAKLKEDRMRLERLLREGQDQESALENNNAQEQKLVATLSSELEGARAAEAQALQRLEQLNAERQSDQVAIAAQNREIRALNERLENQKISEDENKNVAEAENNLRELVGARNLHIVDVYDTDSKGKTKRAVGRVFYTEGQSLVFYAYDLSDGRSDANKYAYYVWGNKDGNLETVRNLGTLGTDDILQKRWKLQVSDAAVLADIDRVFVTVEPAGKLGPRPRGKKILSAYLGGPINHP